MIKVCKIFGKVFGFAHVSLIWFIIPFIVEYMEIFQCWFFAKLPDMLRKNVTTSPWYAASTGCDCC